MSQPPSYSPVVSQAPPWSPDWSWLKRPPQIGVVRSSPAPVNTRVSPAEGWARAARSCTIC
eukprot:7233330-Heterocapsa_arctica.AAC.1